MSTWTTQTTVDCDPAEVLAVLTEPDACLRWSPVAFRIEALDGDRLQSGTTARIAGGLAGLSVAFDIGIEHAGDRRLTLTARGPMTVDVEYEVYSAPEGVELWATVTVHRARSISGRLVTAAIEALLRGGALNLALRRIAGEVDRRAAELIPDRAAHCRLTAGLVPA